jgi:hypothetical protein
MSSYYTVKFRGFTSKYPTMQVIADKLSRSFIRVVGQTFFQKIRIYPFITLEFGISALNYMYIGITLFW